MENIDPSLLLGLLSQMNKGDSPPADNAPSGGSNTNDLLMKFLLNGGLQQLFAPKNKPPEPPLRTVNLDDYVRVD